MFNDARDAQIAFLSLFLLLGVSRCDWTLHPGHLLAAIASCLLAQWVATVLIPYFQQRRWWAAATSDARPVQLATLPGWRSAAITSLGLCLLLRANSPLTMALAGGLAIASKFVFCYKRKHCFNPANFGIVAALLLTGDAWVSPGQWGADAWYLLVFASAGCLVLGWVGRWDTSLAFLASYAGLEAARSLYLHQGWDIWTHQFSSGSLLLFALFMLTDPRSIPNARAARLVWALAIAIATFVLQHQFYSQTALFWALFALAPLTPLLDALWQAPQFSWQAVRRDRGGSRELAVGNRG